MWGCVACCSGHQRGAPLSALILGGLEAAAAAALKDTQSAFRERMQTAFCIFQALPRERQQIRL